ncbi:MAG: response regulator [Alphaproteobacteria bacterium]
MGRINAKKMIRILMLEDEPTDAERAERELHNANMMFISKHVSTREAFIQSLEDFRPDIILADYKLPSFDGMSALGIVQYEHPEVPVVIVTGALSDVEAVALMRAGARDYVLKDRLARLAPAVLQALAAEQESRAHKAAEIAVHDSEAKLNLIFDTMSEGVVMNFVDGTAYTANPSAERLLGFTFEQMRSVPWPNLPWNAIHEDGSAFPGEEHPVMVTLQTGTKCHDIIMGIVHPDKSIVWLSINAEPLFYPGETKPYAAVTTFNDITARKKAEMHVSER